MVKGEYVGKILSGEKTTTIRLGVVRVKYRDIIIHGGGRPVAKALVTSVKTKRVSDLTDEDARRDGFPSREKLIEALEEAYGSVGPQDTVTIIEFRVTRRFDELSTENPYMGLEPADIARLALRYLDLPEEERRILEDVTRTNSIRHTASRLLGGVNKRWIVRRILRRSLRELVRRGIIGSRARRAEARRR